MARFIKDQGAAFGQSPGSLVFIGKKRVEHASLSYMRYNEQQCTEAPLSPDESLPQPGDEMLWLNVVGIHDTDLVAKIGATYDLHDLLLEAVVNTGLRPRMEEFDDCIYFSLKMLRFDEQLDVIRTEQISIIVKDKLVITFQEEEGDVFDALRDRIRSSKGRVRRAGPDYLAFALLDLLFDHYIFTMERFGDEIEDLEDDILENPSEALLEKINLFKREVNYLRKQVRPVKEITLVFAKLESPLIHKHTRQFLKDLVSSASQATDVIDSYANMLSDFLQIYHTSISSKTNEVMKVLTIFAAIFIPLTFIAGIYGTNFDYIPEVKYKYSYFIFWGVLLLVGGVMLLYFKRKKWL